jgi:hypothetical protein
MESVLRDRRLGARSEQQLRCIATRWGLAFGGNGASVAPLTASSSSSLAVPVPPADREILEQAAQERGLSTASFAADLLHVIASQRLIRAVMDDDDR